MNSETKRRAIAIPFGTWDTKGNWYPNPRLQASADEQWAHNVKHGYVERSTRLQGGSVIKPVNMNKPPRTIMVHINGAGRRLPARILGKIDSESAPFVVAARFETGELLYCSDEEGVLYDIRSNRLAYMRVVEA